MKESLPIPEVLVMVVVAIVTAWHGCPSSADGQVRASVARGGVSAAVVLARVCVKEAGFDVTAHECSAIIQVLRARNRDGVARPLIGYGARVYTSAGPRGWIADLRADGRVPSLWPRGLRWADYRERWLRVVLIASAPMAEPCDEAPAHWGDRHGDRERAIRNGWIEVYCGPGTRNMFWRVR